MTVTIVFFRKKVLTHYKKHGRHTLPWRKTKDPYKILVSEIMLQQTQVDRVIPYYKNFLKRFPTVRALAKASLPEVLTIWSGLGYNRRAKFLHEAAKAVLKYHDGKIPQEYAILRALRGVGEYTAKAVRVFAYDEPEVMLETNIKTVLIHEFFPRGRKVRDERLIPILESLLQQVESSRIWYWALMDYGTHIKKTHGNAARKSKTYAKQKPFKGSQREVRGAILKAYVASGRKPSVRVLAKKTGFTEPRIEKALTALAVEGLI